MLSINSISGYGNYQNIKSNINSKQTQPAFGANLDDINIIYKKLNHDIMVAKGLGDNNNLMKAKTRLKDFIKDLSILMKPISELKDKNGRDINIRAIYSDNLNPDLGDIRIVGDNERSYPFQIKNGKGQDSGTTLSHKLYEIAKLISM